MRDSFGGIFPSMRDKSELKRPSMRENIYFYDDSLLLFANVYLVVTHYDFSNNLLFLIAHIPYIYNIYSGCLMYVATEIPHERICSVGDFYGAALMM